MLFLIYQKQHRHKHNQPKWKLLPETQHHEYNHLHWLLVGGYLNAVSYLMFPFVALQADKLLGEPRNTNMSPFLYAVCYFSDQDCQIQIWQHACKCTFTHKLKKFLHLWYTLQSATLLPTSIHTVYHNTVYKYKHKISITIETIVCNIDTDCYDNLRGPALMCLLTFQSNSNFILS